MDESILLELHRMVDEYALEPTLNATLRSFIAEKASEKTSWAEMTRCTHRMLGGRSPDLERHAALTELIILLLDIVDDLQDRDSPNRPWMTCEPAVTLNAVLAMFAAILGQCGQSGIGSAVGSLLARSIQGQQADITDKVLSEEDYFHMVADKSGTLLQLAVYMGSALVDGVDSNVQETLNQLAVCGGIVSQIENDARDVLRLDFKNDLLHKKRTLPVLFMLEDSHAEFPALNEYYAGTLSREQFAERQREFVQYARDSGCIEYCKVVQALYKDKANELYELLPPMLEPWAGQFREIFVPDYDVRYNASGEGGVS
ncbi:polyprenyl synthetase family protein [Cohnella rhizosphaerae]|uniref:Polyprenyl synthetase family protein n=1 Tax=Cohnella rhizosphaerae TaxID=1457232 RepID=A0A9X4KXA0_9BACL|nr:polyprenyl synthetase family protein [Cohnella rhizosphaerae]MDG0812865.1 polyprenyl synthetase family protein [Cohnella rhizosphaerae]